MSVKLSHLGYKFSRGTAFFFQHPESSLNTKNITERPVPLEIGTQWKRFAEAGRTKPNEYSLWGTDFFFWYLT